MHTGRLQARCGRAAGEAGSASRAAHHAAVGVAPFREEDGNLRGSGGARQAGELRTSTLPAFCPRTRPLAAPLSALAAPASPHPFLRTIAQAHTHPATSSTCPSLTPPLHLVGVKGELGGARVDVAVGVVKVGAAVHPHLRRQGVGGQVRSRLRRQGAVEGQAGKQASAAAARASAAQAAGAAALGVGGTPPAPAPHT